MPKLRWMSFDFKEGGSNEKCPATAGNRARKEGFDRKRGDALWGVVFMLSLCVGDNMVNSPNNQISPPIYALNLGKPKLLNFG